jgi:hypothetical protein
MTAIQVVASSRAPRRQALIIVLSQGAQGIHRQCFCVWQRLAHWLQAIGSSSPHHQQRQRRLTRRLGKNPPMVPPALPGHGLLRQAYLQLINQEDQDRSARRASRLECPQERHPALRRGLLSSSPGGLPGDQV